MIRALFVVVAVSLSLQLSGVGAVFGDTACGAEDCPADASGGDCAPNCHFCTCCSLPRVAPTEVSTGEPRPRTTRTDFLGKADMPPSPEPADILHVPRIVLG